MNLTGKQNEELKTFLRNQGNDFLAPVNKVKEAKKKNLEDFPFETGKVEMYRDTKKQTIISAPYVKAKSLIGMVNASLKEYEDEDRILLDKKPTLIFSGDKGGNMGLKVNNSKFGYNVPEKTKKQDISNYWVYGMFGAPDCYENISLFHGEDFYRDIKQLRETQSVLMTGDVNHLSDFTGHQGASSTYPNPFTHTTRTHLQEYHVKNPNKPHNYNNPACRPHFRSAQSIIESYMENVAKSGENTRRTGKLCYSTIGKPLFPLLKDVHLLKQIVPPGLHLIQGIFAILFASFVVLLKSLDGTLTKPMDDHADPDSPTYLHDIDIETDEVLDIVNEEFASAVKGIDEKLQEAENDREKVSNSWHDLENYLIATGNRGRKRNYSELEEENDQEVGATDTETTKETDREETVSGTVLNVKKVPVKEQCKRGQNCIMLSNIKPREWIFCDECQQWFHSLCEGIFFNMNISAQF